MSLSEMSLSKKVMVIVLGSVLALIVGRGLTTATLQNVISTIASAVWGS
jgi:hypothetical protein